MITIIISIPWNNIIMEESLLMLPFGLRIDIAQYAKITHPNDIDIINLYGGKLTSQCIIVDNVARLMYYYDLWQDRSTDYLAILCCQYNSIKCLEFIISKKLVSGFTDVTLRQMVTIVVKSNNFECFRLLCVNRLIPDDSVDVPYIIRNGLIECLQLLCDIGHDMDRFTYSAVYYNKPDCLKILLAAGYKQTNDSVLVAVNYGYYECLKLLVLNDKCKYLYEISSAICRSDDRCLKLLLEHNYPLPSSPTIQAVKRGKLKCLEVLFEAGVEPDEKLMVVATNLGNYKCLELIIKKGCYTNADVIESIDILNRKKQPKCLELLKSLVASE